MNTSSAFLLSGKRELRGGTNHQELCDTYRWISSQLHSREKTSHFLHLATTLLQAVSKYLWTSQLQAHEWQCEGQVRVLFWQNRIFFFSRLDQNQESSNLLAAQCACFGREFRLSTYVFSSLRWTARINYWVAKEYHNLLPCSANWCLIFWFCVRQQLTRVYWIRTKHWICLRFSVSNILFHFSFSRNSRCSHPRLQWAICTSKMKRERKPFGSF